MTARNVTIGVAGLILIAIGFALGVLCAPLFDSEATPEEYEEVLKWKQMFSIHVHNATDLDDPEFLSQSKKYRELLEAATDALYDNSLTKKEYRAVRVYYIKANK